MTTTITIALGTKGAVGTIAFVTRTRWLRKPVKSAYVCHRAASLLSAEWIEKDTGIAADERLALQINYAAQAAARLAGRA